MAAQESRATPKSGASSRLLSMGFMRRGLAQSSSPITPKSEDQHSAKRRKVTNGTTPDVPASAVIDQEAIRKALEEDENRRQAAIEKKAHLDYRDVKEDTSPLSAGQDLSDIPKRRRFNMKAVDASVRQPPLGIHSMDKG
jgi:hypothetical protein